jgi:hypothetical protein
LGLKKKKQNNTTQKMYKKVYVIVQIHCLQLPKAGICAVALSAETAEVLTDFQNHDDDWLHKFEEWCRINNIDDNTSTVVTGSDWDLKTLLPKYLEEKKQRLSGYLHKLFRTWTNIKTVFSITMGTKPTGIEGMLANLKIKGGGLVDICTVLTLQGCDLTVPTCRWTPKTLWYEISRYSSGNITLSSKTLQCQ